MFHKVPEIVSKTGLTYEISDTDWTVVSVSTNGKRKILKPSEQCQVSLAGEQYKVYNIAKLVGLDPKSWPDDEREWEELNTTSCGFGYRYRAFRNAQVQKMDQHGNVSYQEHAKRPNGYYTVSIDGKNVLVHQMMGETKFVPKPNNMPTDWTVHHKNNDASNNDASNLVWASPNTQSKERRPMEQQRIDSCPVIGIALRDVTLKDGTVIRKGEDTQTFDNVLKAADAVGGNQGNISSCIRGKQSFHAYFTWRTPPSDLDLDKEVFKSIGSGKQSERLISTFGRLKHIFHNGYTKIRYAKDMLSERQQRETDSYPKIKIKGKTKPFHCLIVNMFFGKIPKTVMIDDKEHNLIVDHIDGDKQNSRLGNLQLLTQQENTKKRFLKTYTTSVASMYNDEYEYHKTRNDAIEYVKCQGYPDATLEELNACVMFTSDTNILTKLYGRLWIRAHFE
ncbi:hypothetical protein PBCVKS1B_018L [Paramecium bursaria Chlorella virus KS1B]|nr:hypothetical protein PBCVCvsA1_035L [Paramecium bursaria Chlorella virus CvsA1]AGE54452.1 hypothetical protein PBCVKS1B_018L [Paramecium bursaria Chlorella virus KS1B]